ncbi:MAG: arginine-tRNA-protein transferase [Bacteroidota bacterium]
MFAEKHYPEMMLPEELDAYLASGWYRMGQTIFTTHFLCFGDQFYSAIWIRLHLGDYSFRKSLRKLIRKNLDQFTVSFHRATITPEKERLYRRYKGTFPGILAPTLRDSLLDGEDYNIYDTYEVRVRDHNRLVALSYMDKGSKGLASITGIYDGQYRKHSLGFFTMLMEIAFCLDHGIEYYYPGYVVPGYSRFNYKLRIGEVDYFNLQNNKWEPFTSLAQEDIPIEKMRRKLSDLYLLLHQASFPSKVYYYPLFEANLFGFWKAPYFDYPIFIFLQHPASDHYLLVVYDITQSVYLIVRCSNFDDLQFYFNESYVNSFDQNRFFMELIVLDQILYVCPTKEEAFQLILQKFGKIIK